jgi:hypothetical protein
MYVWMDITILVIALLNIRMLYKITLNNIIIHLLKLMD